MDYFLQIQPFSAELVAWDKWASRMLFGLSQNAAHFDPTHFRLFLLALEWSFHSLVWVSAAFGLALYAYRAHWSPNGRLWKASVFLAAVIVDLFCVGALKLALKRHRPEYNDPRDYIKSAPEADKFSFPSGHASLAAVVAYFGARYLFSASTRQASTMASKKSDRSNASSASNNKSSMAKTLAKWALILYSFLIAISRVVMGRHFLGDVIFGALLGVFVSFLLTRLIPRGLVQFAAELTDKLFPFLRAQPREKDKMN